MHYNLYLIVREVQKYYLLELYIQIRSVQHLVMPQTLRKIHQYNYQVSHLKKFQGLEVLHPYRYQRQQDPIIRLLLLYQNIDFHLLLNLIQRLHYQSHDGKLLQKKDLLHHNTTQMQRRYPTTLLLLRKDYHL